jgi:hypothetical protein
MRRLDPAVAGGLLIAIGFWYRSYALGEYTYGSARRMGPGYFPTWVGFLMASLGAGIVLLGLLRRGDLPRVPLRPLVAISAGGVAFAATVEVFGLVPAVFCLVLIGTLAESPYKPLRAAVLAACLSAIGVTLFSYGLGIPLTPFQWNV